MYKRQTYYLPRFLLNIGLPYVLFFPNTSSFLVLKTCPGRFFKKQRNVLFFRKIAKCSYAQKRSQRRRSEMYHWRHMLLAYFYSIPSNNTITERIFFLISSQWTKERNRLMLENVKGIICVRYNFCLLYTSRCV